MYNSNRINKEKLKMSLKDKINDTKKTTKLKYS